MSGNYDYLAANIKWIAIAKSAILKLKSILKLQFIYKTIDNKINSKLKMSEYQLIRSKIW